MNEVANLTDEQRMAERRQDKTFSQTSHAAQSDWAAKTGGCPFPVKPVCLRNGLNTSTNRNPGGFSRLNISIQRASPGLAKKIHTREQILLEKLRRLEEKMWDKIVERDRQVLLSEL